MSGNAAPAFLCGNEEKRTLDENSAPDMRGPPTGKPLLVYSILGALFLFTGISLIKGTQDNVRPPVR